MHSLWCRNVNDALFKAIDLIDTYGLSRNSRNGPVLQANTPVATTYTMPCERVLFHEWRDANPFFHFYESLWMLAGRNDVAPLTRYVKRMDTFSDDGKTFNAAYGHRWRHATIWDIDQLGVIIENLKKNPEDRRQVLQIWTLKRDLISNTEAYVSMLGEKSNDVACNIAATFQIARDGILDMVVFCRSNDIIWGAYGANAVHFSFLLEYMARSIGVRAGTYTHVSVNWHAYVEILDKLKTKMAIDQAVLDNFVDPYVDDMRPYPLMSVDRRLWDIDVRSFVTNMGTAPDWRSFHDPFFIEVALPIVRAHDLWKAGQADEALSCLEKCRAADWQKACSEWIQRRNRG